MPLLEQEQVIVKVVKCASVAVTLMELKLELAALAWEYSAAEAGSAGNEPSIWRRTSSRFEFCSLASGGPVSEVSGDTGVCTFCKLYSE
jgi:hypothetical protein